MASALAQGRRDSVTARTGPWPIKTREHVDLWLHGFALLSEDTSQIPLFAKGYRDAMIVTRNGAQLFTRLDSARVPLQRLLATSPRVTNAQFFALHFVDYVPMRTTIALMAAVKGDPRAAGERERVQQVALALNYFALPAEQRWAEQFGSALDDEGQRFYHGYWLQQQRERGRALSRGDSLWRANWYPKLAPFLRRAYPRGGEIIASTVVEGEGRTLTADPGAATTIVATLPPTVARTAELLYGIVHELVGGFAEAMVTENITPKQKAAGLGARLQTAAALHAGLLLLQRTIPEEAEGYALFYLRLLGQPTPAPGAAAKALAESLPIPAEILSSINSQLDLLLEGL
jgi:hypothetical protein